MYRDHIMLSIKPYFSSKIFAGQKTVELRRIRPKRISNNTIILVYTSSPIKTFSGAFSIKKIVEKPVDDLWKAVGHKSGINFEDYIKYFEGATKGIGIIIDKIFPLSNPVYLSELRSSLTKFSPPQSFKYLSKNEINVFSHHLKKVSKYLADPPV